MIIAAAIILAILIGLFAFCAYGRPGWTRNDGEDWEDWT